MSVDHASSQMPDGACDCHFHVFGPAARYPYAPGRAYTPPDAPLDAYRTFRAGLGLQRCVIVQPSVYGLDNSCTLDALDALGSDARGIVVLDDGFTEADIAAMHERGARGVRFNLLFPGGPDAALIGRVADLVRPFGWHIQLLIDCRDLPELAPALRATKLPLVFDHFGHVPAVDALRSPGFIMLLEMLRQGEAWCKISGAYRISREADATDCEELASALAEAGPSRLVWGSDWPHPGFPDPSPGPDVLLRRLFDWMGHDLATAILARNPADLYDFGN